MDCKYKSQSGEMEFCKAMLEVRNCVVVGQSCEPNVLLSHDTTKCEIQEREKINPPLIQFFNRFIK